MPQSLERETAFKASFNNLQLLLLWKGMGVAGSTCGANSIIGNSPNQSTCRIQCLLKDKLSKCAHFIYFNSTITTAIV